MENMLNEDNTDDDIEYDALERLMLKARIFPF